MKGDLSHRISWEEYGGCCSRWQKIAWYKLLEAIFSVLGLKVEEMGRGGGEDDEEEAEQWQTLQTLE